MAYAVTENHVRVPRGTPGTWSVYFDDSYVWSFTTPRDAVGGRLGAHVRWPAVLSPLLSGTTTVSLRRGDERVFERSVSFRGVTQRLLLTDRHGHQVAVDRAGHLTRVFAATAEETRREVVDGARQALDDLRSLGYDAHLTYGCLLGAVRDGGMIGHDSDADLAYLSPFTTPAQVIVESYGMERGLRARGWDVVRMSGADLKLMHRLPDGRVVHIDVFAAFHVGETFYQLGGRSGTLPRAALTPASTVTLEGVELAAPADPEAVLTFLYGPAWRTPDPAFQNADPPGGLRRIEGWVRGVRADVVPWNEFFRDRRHEIGWRPTSCARWVADRLDPGAPIADLGSGTGRDAAWFSRRGRPTYAYDIAGAAVRQTRRRMLRSGADGSAVRTLALNDRRSVLVAGAELARTDEPANLYARHLVGCLDDEALDHLWLLGSMALRRGGSLFLEFSTGRGRRLDPHLLMSRVPTSTVVAGITARGGVVDEVTVGPGDDFLDHPDRSIARIVAHWPHPSRGAGKDPS